MEKTNVMRILTQQGIEFTAHEYDNTLTVLTNPFLKA